MFQIDFFYLRFSRCVCNLQINKVAEIELEKYKEVKLTELRKLENEYQKALSDVGLGHAEVERELGLLQQKDHNLIRQREIAEVRGEHALKVVAHHSSLKEKLVDEKKNLKKSVKLMEDTRAAKVRCKKEIVGTPSVVEIPIPTEEGKRVRFSDSAKETSGVIVRAYDKVVDKVGVEDAIREEMDRRQEAIDQRKVARNRSQAALKRSQMSRPLLTDSFFEDSTSEVDEFKDVAMNMETNLLTDSSESSSLHATIHQENRHVPKFAPDYGLIQGVVLGQAVDQSSPKSRIAPKSDENFVAKVLEGMELPVPGDLQVSVKIDEVSTFASSATSVESSQILSSSSDITKEKFLSEAWKTQDIRGLIGEFRSRQNDSPGQSQLKGKLTILFPLCSCKRILFASGTAMSITVLEQIDLPYTLET